MQRLVVGIAALLIGAGAQAQIVLKLGTVDAQASHSGVGAEAFAAEVAKLSGGQMKVEVFHAGKLGGIPDQQKNVLQGAQDLHLLYPEFLAGLIDETKIISAPYVFRDLNHAQAYLKSGLFKPGVDKLRSLGGVILDPDWTWMQKDPRGLIAVRPVKTPKDLEGMKLRIWESKTAIETGAAWAPTPSSCRGPRCTSPSSKASSKAGPRRSASPMTRRTPRWRSSGRARTSTTRSSTC